MKTSKKIECKCGETTEFANVGLSFNIGEVQQATGWKYLLERDGDGTWLCKKCTPKAVALAQELLELIGSVDIPLWCILK